MSTVPNFLEFTINAVLCPTFIRKLCYKLPSVVTFTLIQIFYQIVPSLLNGIKVATFAIDTASKFALFSVSGLKDKKLIKKANLHEK